MTPHEREQLLELAEQIVLNLRSRLAAMTDIDVFVPDPDATAFHRRRHSQADTSLLQKEDEPHDQI